MRRLFLLAAYDPQSIVGESLLLMLRTLSGFGDVVFVADSILPEDQLAKVSPYVLHAESERHGEYDFGSYKRAFIWCCRNLNLTSYDVMYLVNDSVFGPLSSPDFILGGMESLDCEAFSLVRNPNARHPHLQSWFIGLRPSVFLSPWFASFLGSVRPMENKESVCIEYEIGFTALLSFNGVTYDSLFKVRGRGIYNSVLKLNRIGIPFIKKASFTRHCGCLGHQLRLVLESCPSAVRDAVLSDASRLWGAEYVQTLLNGNFLTMIVRFLRYLRSKIL